MAEVKWHLADLGAAGRSNGSTATVPQLRFHSAGFTAADLQLPDLQLPDLQLPDLQLPDLQLPRPPAQAIPQTKISLFPGGMLTMNSLN